MPLIDQLSNEEKHDLRSEAIAVTIAGVLLVVIFVIHAIVTSYKKPPFRVTNCYHSEKGDCLDVERRESE